jgi:hypothetical protein
MTRKNEAKLRRQVRYAVQLRNEEELVHLTSLQFTQECNAVRYITLRSTLTRLLLIWPACGLFCGFLIASVAFWDLYQGLMYGIAFGPLLAFCVGVVTIWFIRRVDSHRLLWLIFGTVLFGCLPLNAEPVMSCLLGLVGYFLSCTQLLIFEAAVGSK